MKDWYLMTDNSRPNVLGGYENDAFLNEKQDAFIESLGTAIGSTVMLYNSDLTEIGLTRVIIQDNLANTQLKSLERSALAPIGTLRAGMYIGYEDRYWLVSGYPGNNGICEKATLILCQLKIKWQNDSGKIIERWANFVSASKYDIGENGNYYIALTSNNFTVWIPEDDDGETLDGKRIFVDRNINNPHKVFKITRSDDVLYLYGESHGGILSFIADKVEFDKERDRPDLGLCDYHSSVPLQTVNNVNTRVSGSSYLKCGQEGVWSVEFIDKETNDLVNCDFEWNVVCEDGTEIKYDAENDIYVLVDENDISIIDENRNRLISSNRIIRLSTIDEDSVGSSILLQVIMNEKVVAEKKITVSVNF